MDEEMEVTYGRGKGRDKVNTKGKAMANEMGKSKDVAVNDGMDLDEPSPHQLPESMNVDETLGGHPVITKCPLAGIIRIKPVSQINATIALQTSTIDHPFTPSF
jgi:hypothetical protein